MVSYADFVTLLLAFFVVMYSISSVSEGRYRKVSEALQQAFKTSEPRKPAIMEANRLPPAVSPQPSAAGVPGMQAMAEDIRSVLDDLMRSGQVRVTETERGIAVEIDASVLFAPGDAELGRDAARSLTAIARILARTPNGLLVEGHTDNSPISSPMFPTNWELSSARASRVVRLFAQAGVAPERMGAVGFGEHRSIDTNTTPEGRSRNRRVTVVIMPPHDPARRGDSPW
jgi:chemotaxis protein MotB